MLLRWNTALKCGLALFMLTLASCQSAPPLDGLADPEVIADFRQNLEYDLQKVATSRDRTRQGKNLSEFSMGWLAYKILTEVASQDGELYAYLNQDKRDITTYMDKVFRYHPAEEVAALDRLANQDTEHRTVRLIARNALEALRHIPNGDEEVAIQQRDRDVLSTTLETLHHNLDDEIHVLDERYPPHP